MILYYLSLSSDCVQLSVYPTSGTEGGKASRKRHHYGKGVRGEKGFLILWCMDWDRVTFLVLFLSVFKFCMCIGSVHVCNHMEKAFSCIKHTQNSAFLKKIVVQITAEEIKDTRVVNLEIEARNLDKRELINLFFK